MALLCDTSVTTASRSGTQKVVLDPLSGPVARTFKVTGLSECEIVTVVVKDAAGAVIWGPRPAPAGTNLGTEFYWSAEITLLSDCSNVTVTAYCAKESDGDSITGLDVKEAIDVIDPVVDPAPGTRRLKFMFRLNNWRGTWQSAVLVVKGRLTRGGTVMYSHLFSECPPRMPTYDFGIVDPGLYVAQLTFIDGQTSVSTVSTRKLIE
jgi:hypothetical protein